MLAIAIGDRRICLTFDKDFGELAAGAPLPEECGVVLLRLAPPAHTVAAMAVAAILELQVELRTMKRDMLRWMIGVAFARVGLTVAIIRFLQHWERDRPASPVD